MPRIEKVATNPGDHVLTLTLDDGRTTRYDVAPMLWGPAFEPLKRDRSLFDAVRVSSDGDTVVWPTGAEPTSRRKLSSPAQPCPPGRARTARSP